MAKFHQYRLCLFWSSYGPKENLGKEKKSLVGSASHRRYQYWLYLVFWSLCAPSEYDAEYPLHLARNPFWLLRFNPLSVKFASNFVNIYFRNVILSKSRTFTFNGSTIWFSFTGCLLCSCPLCMCDARVVRTESHLPQDYPVWVMTMAWPMDAHTECEKVKSFSWRAALVCGSA